ncbi:Serine acetyltransferase [Buchnera aphidicola (Eriosoma grossulariae)]
MLKTLDIVWNTIITETEFFLKNEPFLSHFYYQNILQHDSLIDSMAFILSNKLSNSMISDNFLKKIFKEAYFSDISLIECVNRDIQAIYYRDPSIDNYIIPFLYFKGFHALQGYRISNYLWTFNQKSLALHLQNQISTVFSVDIHPAAKIGSGVMFDHATGIVIGETVVIEDNVSILQSVTLGGTGKIIGDRHPKIRSDVMIGAGAKVLGNIEVGIGAKIGAGAVVLNSIPAYSTVVGIPAKIVKYYNKKMLINSNIDKIRHKNYLMECNFEYGSGI